ncbi:MAG: hypothetical protein SFU55_09420 [Methylophilus sp.]|nr:hypothetical protein [Methylophilus sp.]
MNSFVYVGANPLKNTDTSGLFLDEAAYLAAQKAATASGVAIGTGLAATIGIATGVAIPSPIGDGEIPGFKDKACRNCPPCRPYAVGSLGFQGPKVNQQGVDKGVPHYILFEVQQIPSTCQCIWKENTKGLVGSHHANSPLGIDLNGLPRPPPYPGR